MEWLKEMFCCHDWERIGAYVNYWTEEEENIAYQCRRCLKQRVVSS